MSVDRKSGLEELSRNLMNRNDASRFWREVRRAHANGTKLIVLCECGGKYRCVNDLTAWKSKYSSVTGRRLINEMVRCEYAYGVSFKFCDRRSTARRIIELLTEYGKGDTSKCRDENNNHKCWG